MEMTEMTKSNGSAQQYSFVDNLIEDEAEIETLLSKPTCFIVAGKPGIGKSALARRISESWRCVLIDDTDLINKHIEDKTKEGLEILEILNAGKALAEEKVLELILARLDGPDLEHYGYILSCLPFLSEECLNIEEQITLIKNLKLSPDFIINIKCADKDLAARVSGLKQSPDTGQFYNRDQWKWEDVFVKKLDSTDEEEEEEDDDEQTSVEELKKEEIDLLVWLPENLPQNVQNKIDIYRNIVLRHLEDYIAGHNPLYLLELDGHNTVDELHTSVISRLGSMAIKRVSVPIVLSPHDDEEEEDDDDEFEEELDIEDAIRNVSSSMMVAPGFRWRRSRWGQICPVALKEGTVTPGKPDYSLGFQDKMYFLSTPDACKKFIANPRRYLLPPMPRHPCKISILGPPLSGKTTICKLLAKHYDLVMLDLDELVQPFLAGAEEKRMEEIKEEATRDAIVKVKKMEEEKEMQADKPELDDSTSVEVTEDHPEVKAMVLSALEEAQKQPFHTHGVYTDVLEQRVKEIEEADADTGVKTGWILDNYPSKRSQMDALVKGRVLPDIIFCLNDSNGHQTLQRLYEMNKSKVDEAWLKRMQEEPPAKDKQPSEKKVKDTEPRSDLETVPEESDGVVLSVHGYPEGPEMKEYKQKLQSFSAKWEKMESGLTIPHLTLEIEGKTPEKLAQDIINLLNKPFQYVPSELLTVDIDEEADDLDALTVMERAEEKPEATEPEDARDDVDTAPKRLLGDTNHFCPVALKNQNVLWPCTEEIAAKYRERVYYFSSIDAREAFLQDATQFVVKTEPLKPPALRVLMLGTRGSGKTTHGEWLAKQLGLFHIQYREQLQTLIMPKTKKPVPYADEVEVSEEMEELEIQIRELKAEVTREEIPAIEEIPMTEEEAAIKAYLSDDVALPPEVLDIVVQPFWKQEPFRSTGFILEGFPSNPDEVQYLLSNQLFPDLIVVMVVDVADVQKRLLPKFLEKWTERRDYRRAQLKLLVELRKKRREENVAKRRAELLAGMSSSPKSKIRYRDEDEEGEEEEEWEEEEEEADNNDDDIEALLEEEFPPEWSHDDAEDEEPRYAAIERLEMEIGDRFSSDEVNLESLMEGLSEHNLPNISINASRKPSIVRQQLLSKVKPLLENRESLFQRCQPISPSLAQRLLHSSYKFHSAFGWRDPIKLYKEGNLIQPLQWPVSTTNPLLFNQYIYFFATKKNRNTFMLNPLKYLRQPKPIPSLPLKIAIVGPPKSGKTAVATRFAKLFGLAKLSVGTAMRIVLETYRNTDLALQMKLHLYQGLIVPDELAIQCLEVSLMSTICTTRGCVLDGFPMTEKQAELMSSWSIIPMIVIDLELDKVMVLKRGQKDRMKPNKPYLAHDSTEILHIRTAHYRQEVDKVRRHFERQYQNWILLDASKNKWWIWTSIVKEVSTSMMFINIFLERKIAGQAACINRLCITPLELQQRIGEFGHYCPVCLALYYHLVDCSETKALTHAADYKGHYFKMCGAEHLEMFLSTPDQFVAPGCPHTLPPPELLPQKLNEIELRDRFPQPVELRGFCPVTFKNGYLRYEALCQGNFEYAVEYRQRIYVFRTLKDQDTFLRSPETYWDLKLPNKTPPLREPVPLTSLPMLGYLEQGVAVAVIKATTAVGCLKPKHPFLSVRRSAIIYVASYLKAFNPKSSEDTRQIYKKRLALFEENCALIPYLSATMEGKCKRPTERTINFEYKLSRFLALENTPEANYLV